jgi:hypothetical protein
MGRTFDRDIKAALTDAGCRFVRAGKGNHEIWWSPVVERHVTVPTNCVSRHTANAVPRLPGRPAAPSSQREAQRRPRAPVGVEPQRRPRLLRQPRH